MNIIKSFSLMSFFTFLSRILGYLRDLIFAFTLGATSNADSFLLAFRLPNLFRRLFAEGAINNALIPIYINIKKKSNEENARLFSSHVFSFLIIILILVTIICEIFMIDIIRVLAPGFSEELIIKTSFLASIMFPYLILISASSFIAALLNAKGKFALWAFVPIILNVSMIIAMAISYHSSLVTELLLSWSVIISGLLQFFIIFFWGNQNNIKFKIVIPKFNKDIKKLFKLLLPNVLAGGIIQINQFVGVIFASSISGAISWLYYADRITQLPMGIFIVSISTILLTFLSRHETQKNYKLLKKGTDNSILLVLSITALSMVGLFVLSDLIVDILFRRGKFGFGDVLATSDAIFMYAVGLPAFGFIKVFSVIFFSKQDTYTPFKVSAVAMIINFFLVLSLTSSLGHLGIALSLSIASWINALMLYVLLYYKGYWIIDKSLIKKILKIILCSFLTYLVLIAFYMLIFFTEQLNLTAIGSKIIALILLIFVALLLFLILLIFMRLISLKDLNLKNLKSIFREKDIG